MYAKPIVEKSSAMSLNASETAYKTPVLTGNEFSFPNFGVVFGATQFNKASCRIIENGTDVYNYSESGGASNPVNTPSVLYETTLKTGSYQVIYNVTRYATNATTLAVYYFFVTSNTEPLPPWNVRTVIERALIIAETIRKGDTPRFHLNAEQAAEFEKIETPEFHFTNSTLREILQGIGAYVHGEPRLRGNEIYYEMYGSGEKSTVYLANYAAKSFQQTIDSYVTNLDSSVDNFVNTLGYAKGVIIEPYRSGFKTVRTEKTYSRIEENNLFISTTFPIRRISKLYCGWTDEPPVDITPYVFEASEYARLSSYQGLYPTSRAYGIYYTTGQKNIEGLTYKQDNPITEVFSRYAILNILRAATGNDSLDIVNYSGLAFRVEYEPIYPTRVQQNKSYYVDIRYPRTIAYNQGQNLIETKYYGENLKGAIARLGNVDKVITMVQRRTPRIPKVGTLYDDEYYISAVAVEMGGTYTKISCALSKDFNRYSDYVGVNSTKRFYEISEQQAYDSVVTYRDFVVIGDGVEADSPVLFNTYDIAAIFKRQNASGISVVLAQGEDASGNPLNEVVLPVMSSALGNASVFSFKYQDNYSAGDNASYQISGQISGYFQNAVAYCDPYGNMEYLNLKYYAQATAPNRQTQTEIGTALPTKTAAISGVGNTRIDTGSKPLWVKKGNTEILSVSYQIEFVSNRRKLIVGSGLAANNPMIVGEYAGHDAALYVLPYRLNKFDLQADLTGATLIYDYSTGLGMTSSGNTITFSAQTSTVAGQAWVMVDKATGDVLMGENTEITGDGQTDILRGLRMTCVHDLFKIKNQ